MYIEIKKDAKITFTKLDAYPTYRVEIGECAILVPGRYENILFGFWSNDPIIRQSTIEQFMELAKTGAFDNPFDYDQPAGRKFFQLPHFGHTPR